VFQAQAESPASQQPAAPIGVLNGMHAPDFDDDPLSDPIPFAGDLFGTADTYLDDDFGQGGLCDEDESDDEWAAAAALEQQDRWEPPVPVADVTSIATGREPVDSGDQPDVRPPAVLELDPEIEHLFNSDPYFANPTSSEERRKAETRAGTQNPVIERYSDVYPDTNPGRIYSQDGSTTVSADAKSAAKNPYAPFASKIEWEVARWAKLRGPGSTAFSELLGIDGVCVTLSRRPSCEFTFNFRFRTPLDYHLGPQTN
jgi:hypothetical protein